MTLKEFHAKVDYIMNEEKALVDRFFEAAQAHQVASSNGSVVIYIEDDPDQVSLFKTMMACYSTLTVIPALNDEDARRLITKRIRRIKCVVMDISLDKDDRLGVCKGMALLSWVKAAYPELFVIVLTSHAELISDLRAQYPDIEVHLKARDLEKIVTAITADRTVGAF